MKKLFLSGLVLALGLIVAGCAAPPKPAPKPQSYAVLLENSDGSASAVVISGAKGQVIVDRPRQGINLDGATPPFPIDESRIKAEFGQALSARPQLPVSFLLYFEVGGARLTPESQSLVANIVEAVKNRPAPDVSIIGHTDTVGEADANEKLGLQRAQSIAQVMAEAGLKAQDITITSHGERDLLVRTPDNTAEPKNRRVEITVR